jgi:hypothetical protein
MAGDRVGNEDHPLIGARVERFPPQRHGDYWSAAVTVIPVPSVQDQYLESDSLTDGAGVALEF